MPSPTAKKSFFKSKLLFAIIILILLSLLSLYVLDEYVFRKKSGVYFTRGPEKRERVMPLVADEKEDEEEKVLETEKKIDAVKPKNRTEVPPLLETRTKTKSINEVMTILGVAYSESVISEWRYNIENARGKKLKKRIVGKGELSAWDNDMLGGNASRLSGGVEEFYKVRGTKEEAEKDLKDGTSQGDIKEKSAEEPEPEEVSEEEIAQKEIETPKDEGEKAEGEKKERTRLDRYSYKITRFMPGYASDGYSLDYTGMSFEDAASGNPDFDKTGDIKGVEKVDDYKNSFLALGNGGSIVYEVIGGELIDGDGPDFVVYGDSAFSDFIKTAKVEVSWNGYSYEEFSCNPVSAPFYGCAGVHPVDIGKGSDPLLVGGDAFDLKKVGLKKVRYIRITDTGDNYSAVDMTDGFNIDSIALIHAYEEEKSE